MTRVHFPKPRRYGGGVSTNDDWQISENDGLETIERKLGNRERERLARAARNYEMGRPEITELEVGNRTYSVAPIEPMDVDGVRTVQIGAIAWLVVAIALIPFWTTLGENDRQWWLSTAIAGFGLGLMGLEYTRRRRNALRAQKEIAAQNETNGDYPEAGKRRAN